MALVALLPGVLALTLLRSTLRRHEALVSQYLGESTSSPMTCAPPPERPAHAACAREWVHPHPRHGHGAPARSFCVRWRGPLQFRRIEPDALCGCVMPVRAVSAAPTLDTPWNQPSKRPTVPLTRRKPRRICVWRARTRRECVQC